MRKHLAVIRTGGKLAVLAFALGLGPAAGAEAPQCPAGTERHAEYRLFFGRSRENVEVVSDADWRGFLAYEITPRFPDGLTVLDAGGQWRDASGTIVRERSKMLLVLAEPGAEGMRLVEEIAEVYKRLFDQESVPRIVGTACASFQ